MNYNTGTGQYINVDGMLVEEDALKVAEALAEYDPNLFILCVQPGREDSISEAPFVIAEKDKDGNLRPVFTAWKLDHTIVDRVKLADTQRINVFDNLVEMERKARLEIDRRYEEERAERKDIVEHIAKIKSKYSVRDPQTNELITFYDDRPATRV